MDLTGEVTSSATPDLAWKETGSSLALLKDGQVLWQFNHLADGSILGCPYFHPLATPDGAVMTDLHPDDHLWHRGLRFAWKKINGLEGYWTWPDGVLKWPDKVMGRTKVVAVVVEPRPDFSAKFVLDLIYHAPGEDAVLNERRTIVVSPPAVNGNYRIDWTGIFKSTGEPVILDRTPIIGEPDGVPWGGYAGLQWRVAPGKDLAAWEIRTSEGFSVELPMEIDRKIKRERLQPGHGKPARWLDITLNFTDGRTGGMTILDHPANLRHPAPWHITSMPNEVICSSLFSGPYTLLPDDQLVFRFRMMVHGGGARPDLIEKRFEKFTQRRR
jgi:hypothetical protein